jgi:hypothetical protein
LRFVPDSSAIDSEGIIYLLSADKNVIFRYDVKNKKYLSNLTPKYHATLLVFSKTLGRLYVSSKERIITYFSSKNPLTEMDYATVPGDIRAMAGRKSTLVVQRGSEYGDAHLIVFDKKGKVFQSDPIIFGLYASRGLVTDETESEIFYADVGISPPDIHKLVYKGTRLYEDMESPYHGDFALSHTLAAGNGLLAVGSGLMFSAKDLSYAGAIPPFDGAIWTNEIRVLAKQEDGEISVKLLDERYFVKNTKVFFGSYAGIFKYQDKIFIAYINSDQFFTVDEVVGFLNFLNFGGS